MRLGDVYGEQIIERGKGYRNNVTYCIKISDSLHAEVEGRSTYRTRVNLKSLSGNCSCPYGTNCKHAVAAYLVYKNGDFINADGFIKHLKSLSKRELITIIVDNLHNNPDMALNHELRTTMHLDSFVYDFIDDFSYSKMAKAERLVSSFTFEQLVGMLTFLKENEDDVFERIYEDYGIADEGEVLYDFESSLEEELVRKIATQEEMRQALRLEWLHDDIIFGAEGLARFKDIIKSAFTKEQFLDFLLNLEEPDMDEIEESITPKSRNVLFHLPRHKPALAERIANRLGDRSLLFLVAVFKEDYKGILKNLSEFDKFISANPYILERKVPGIVGLFMRHNLKDRGIAQKFLRRDFLEHYEPKHLNYLIKQVDDFSLVRNLVDFREEFSLTKVLLERLFHLDSKAAKRIIARKKNLLGGRHWSEVVEILKYLRVKLGNEYVLRLIRANENVFKTSSTLKSNLKKEGILVSTVRGEFRAEAGTLIGMK